MFLTRWWTTSQAFSRSANPKQASRCVAVSQHVLRQHYTELRGEYTAMCDRLVILARRLAEVHEAIAELESVDSSAPIWDVVPTQTGNADMDWAS